MASAIEVVVAQHCDPAALQRTGSIEQRRPPNRGFGIARRLIQRDVDRWGRRKMRLHGADDLFECRREWSPRRERHFDDERGTEAERLANPTLALGGEGEALLARQDAALFQLATYGRRDGDRQAGSRAASARTTGLIAMNRAHQRFDPSSPLAKGGRLRDLLQNPIVQPRDSLSAVGPAVVRHSAIHRDLPLVEDLRRHEADARENRLHWFVGRACPEHDAVELLVPAVIEHGLHQFPRRPGAALQGADEDAVEVGIGFLRGEEICRLLTSAQPTTSPPASATTSRRRGRR